MNRTITVSGQVGCEIILQVSYQFGLGLITTGYCRPAGRWPAVFRSTVCLSPKGHIMPTFSLVNDPSTE